jgi:nucleoside-diphosphate-sugar epimerase
VEHLLNLGYEVVAGAHGPAARTPAGCERRELDVTDAEAVRRAVAETEPDEVYHLAGLTRPAGGAVDEFYRVNFGGALNLLEAAGEGRRRPRCSWSAAPTLTAAWITPSPRPNR